MDSKAFVLLEHLYNLCGERAFTILEREELLPPTFGDDEVDKALTTLTEEGYAAVKYADKTEYCLGLTQQGRNLVVDVRAERARRKKEAAAMAAAEKAKREAEQQAAAQKSKDEEERKRLERQIDELKVALEEERRQMQTQLAVLQQNCADVPPQSATISADDTSSETITDEVADPHAEEDKLYPTDVQPDEIETSSSYPSHIDESEIVPHTDKTPRLAEGARFGLMLWLSAFCGALLGGGVVGFIIYLIHTVA